MPTLCTICNAVLKNSKVFVCDACTTSINDTVNDVGQTSNEWWNDTSESYSAIPLEETRRVVNGRVLPCRHID